MYSVHLYNRPICVDSLSYALPKLNEYEPWTGFAVLLNKPSLG